MYISNVTIENYRSFNKLSVNFNDGINILVGHNNSGKSNLLRTLALIFNNKSQKQLSINDFYNGIPLEDLKQHSPKVTVTITLSQSVREDLKGDELVTVSSWLVKLEEPYIAQVQYEFFLPEEYEKIYSDSMESVKSPMEVWEKIENRFIRLYIYKIWVGNPTNQVQVDGESISKFDFQFLDAIRDVERDMFSGKNALLKDVIDFFMDYDIKSDKTISIEEQSEKISDRKDQFKASSDTLIQSLKERLHKGHAEILAYANHIGASFDNSIPTFEGSLRENEIYSILQLIVKLQTGMTIPIANNGLGYNNLIFMSLLLAKMQVDSDGNYLGSNAKVFPILVIEEPEAHLHPTMQFQFIKFLKDSLKGRKVRQVFITSHSTHITSSAQLDDLICLYRVNDEIHVSYPGKVFFDNCSGEDEQENTDSKKYVQRFLDATKSNILFAERIILVEGIAEQFLIPVFAEYLGRNLEEKHVSIINAGGRYFQHFLYLFDSTKKNTINRRIACITDLDPMRQKKAGGDEKIKPCYPYEFGIENDIYKYTKNTSLMAYKDNQHPNICMFTQGPNYGKTLEYQMAFENPECKLLITPSLVNGEELNNLMDAFSSGRSLEELFDLLRKSEENKRIINALNKELLSEVWPESKKKAAVIASRYLNSVEKGENALELSSILQENHLKNGTQDFQEFHVPEYIKNAIEWVCDDK